MKTIGFFLALWVAFVAIVVTASGEVGKVDSHYGAVVGRSMTALNKGLVFNAAVRNEEPVTKTVTVTADASTVTVTGTPSIVIITEAASICQSVGPSIIVDTTPLAFTPSTPATTPISTGSVSTSELSSITPTSFASTEIVPPTSPATSTGVPATSELPSTISSGTNPPASLSSATFPPSTPTVVASNGDYLGVDISVLMELMGLSVVFMVFT